MPARPALPICAVFGGALLISACVHVPVRNLSCADAERPAITVSADGETATTTLSVLTYNLEGLAWPAASGRAEPLRQIGERLNARRQAGEGPDVVLFQEMFRPAAKRAVGLTGYPAIAAGPKRSMDSTATIEERLPGRAKFRRGEIGFHLFGSGLAIASRYPLIMVDKGAYGFRSCAGFDCLANKGIMVARIQMPGVPGVVDIYDTHMNARTASGAPPARSLAAHDRQALQASAFIEDTHDDTMPLIFGGDFNMRKSEERWENFSRYQSLLLVHRVCADPANACDVRLSWDGDAPWMDTQDLQFFWNGEKVSVRPLRVEALFDGGESGPKLSDHDGFLVTYELRWKVADAPQAPC